METVINKIIAPIAARIGTMVGTSFAAFGFTDSEIETITLAIVALLGVVFDLVVRNLIEKDKE